MRRDDFRRRAGVLVAAALTAATLTACGGEATVDNSDGAAAPSASATKDSGTDTPKDGADMKTGDTGDSARKSAGKASGDKASGDQGAREVSEVPTAPAAEPGEEAFLRKLDDGGIKTAEDRDQLVGVARAVCNGSDDGGRITAEAFAGQLIEQRKTDLNAADAAQLLQEAAREEYC